MKKIIKITKSTISFIVITLISFAISSFVGYLVVLIFGSSDMTERLAASIAVWGTILVAMLFGVFDD